MGKSGPPPGEVVGRAVGPRGAGLAELPAERVIGEGQACRRCDAEVIWPSKS